MFLMIFANTRMLVRSLSLMVSDGRQHWGMTGQDHCQIRCQLVKSCKKEFAGAFHTAKQDVQATSHFKNPPQGFFVPLFAVIGCSQLI